MRKLFTPRRSLLGASTFLLAASSLALLAPGDASASARTSGEIVRVTYYSDETYTTRVGSCVYNAKCSGHNSCTGTQTQYYIETVSQCPF
jgi:hypothetical protein